MGTLLARVNYFREVFAYGADEGDASAPAVSSLLHHPAFKRAAQTVYAGQCDIVKPYACGVACVRRAHCPHRVTVIAW